MRRWMMVAVVILAACGDSGSTVDPYDVWLANKPADAPNLSREDAQTRAILACMREIDWAPGTVDRILVDAYKC